MSSQSMPTSREACIGQYLPVLIREWDADPEDYDLAEVADLLYEHTGDWTIGGLGAGAWREILATCLLPTAAVAQPWHAEPEYLARAEPRFRMPDAGRRQSPQWQQAAAPQGEPMQRVVFFRWPQAPVGAMVLLAAETGPISEGAEAGRYWYRLYMKLRQQRGAAGRLLREGSAASERSARSQVTQAYHRFLRDQCEVVAVPGQRSRPKAKRDPMETVMVEVAVTLPRDEAAQLRQSVARGEDLGLLLSEALSRYAKKRRRRTAAAQEGNRR